jgi:hypothetical protein
MGQNSKRQIPNHKETSKPGEVPKAAWLLKYPDWDFFGV